MVAARSRPCVFESSLDLANYDLQLLHEKNIQSGGGGGQGGAGFGGNQGFVSQFGGILMYFVQRFHKLSIQGRCWPGRQQSRLPRAAGIRAYFFIFFSLECEVIEAQFRVGC